IIAGERRWRAAQRAGLHDVPIIAVEASDSEALELTIIENVQRADLNPLEEAMGYQQLVREFSHSQEEIAKIVGKSRSHVADTLALEKRMSDALGLAVTVDHVGEGGVLHIHYRDLEQLDAVLRRLESPGLKSHG